MVLLLSCPRRASLRSFLECLSMTLELGLSGILPGSARSTRIRSDLSSYVTVRQPR